MFHWDKNREKEIEVEIEVEKYGELGVGNGKFFCDLLDAGSWKLEVGSWKLK